MFGSGDEEVELKTNLPLGYAPEELQVLVPPREVPVHPIQYYSKEDFTNHRAAHAASVTHLEHWCQPCSA